MNSAETEEPRVEKLRRVDGPKKTGRPKGKSNKWADVPSRQSSPRPHSRSPPPLIGSAVPAPRSGSVSPTPLIGRADRSRNASNAVGRTKRPAPPQPRRATLSPIPNGQPHHGHAIVRPQPKRRCSGLYDGYFGAALHFAGKSMQNTGRHLVQWSRERDAGCPASRGWHWPVPWNYCCHFVA